MDKKPKVGTNNSANFFAGDFLGKTKKVAKNVAKLQLCNFLMLEPYFIVFNSKR